MANYIVRECTTETTHIVSASTLNFDDIIVFTPNGTEDQICGVVISSTEDSHTALYVSTEDSCCSCLTGTGLASLTFEFCDTNEQIDIDTEMFCNVYGGLPLQGQTFKFFNLNTEEVKCATFRGANDPGGLTVWEPDEGPYTSCFECDVDTPRSANTENFICIPDCEFTGSTAVVPPHPVWTDGYGTAVTQLNMITIGGNGLNG